MPELLASSSPHLRLLGSILDRLVTMAEDEVMVRSKPE